MIELMIERGYERVTVTDVIDRADVGRSTFYAHYRDKDDLLVVSCTEFLRREIDRVRDTPGSPLAPLRVMFQSAAGYPDVYQPLIGPKSSATVLAPHPALAAGRTARSLRPRSLDARGRGRRYLATGRPSKRDHGPPRVSSRNPGMRPARRRIAAGGNGAVQEVAMGGAHRVIASVGVAAAMTFAGAGVAAAQPEAPEPESQLTQFVEMLPPAPPQCAAMWEPIEDRIEDMVPPAVEPAFDAFDDWCEGPTD
ncbi:TetR/AcrR family transcriptional regulator [Nocardia cyriacigeorgica]|uniref:TetR/AcrR family transcriptional regulator n=2 Tax=Nocardia cyriacigeorgica TaxID=135487 RepID=UPI002455BED2|nr:helix-turn-helix domain-containing protein [Nocardia cyriacigeorgica]